MPPTTDTPATPRRSVRRRTLWLAGVLVAVLAVAAVLYTALTPTSSAPGPAGADGAAGGPVSFTATTTSGPPVTVPGAKPSVLLFFGVSCGGCGPTSTALAQIQQQNPAAANFVGVDITPRETDDDVRGFLTTNHATALGYTFDTDTRLIRALGVTQLTTVVVLDATGAPTWRAVEPTREQVQTALAAAAR